jgi:hypothetical protein
VPPWPAADRGLFTKRWHLAAGDVGTHRGRVRSHRLEGHAEARELRRPVGDGEQEQGVRRPVPRRGTSAGARRAAAGRSDGSGSARGSARRVRRTTPPSPRGARSGWSIGATVNTSVTGTVVKPTRGFEPRTPSLRVSGHTVLTACKRPNRARRTGAGGPVWGPLRRAPVVTDRHVLPGSARSWRPRILVHDQREGLRSEPGLPALSAM